MNFVMKHGAGSIAQPIGQQSSVLPLCYGCPTTDQSTCIYVCILHSLSHYPHPPHLSSIPEIPNMSQKFQTCPRNSQCIPVVPNVSQQFPMYPRSSQCIPVVHNVSQQFPMYPSSYQCVPVVLNVSQQFLMYPSSSQCIPVVPNVSQQFSMYPRSSQHVFPLFLWPTFWMRAHDIIPADRMEQSHSYVRLHTQLQPEPSIIHHWPPAQQTPYTGTKHLPFPQLCPFHHPISLWCLFLTVCLSVCV